MQDVEDGALRPVSIAGETGVRVAPQDFLDVLARHYAELEQQFQDYGFAPVRSAWLAQAARLGEVITARTAREETVGTFETVDAAGNLVIKTPEGPRAIAAADVYF